MATADVRPFNTEVKDLRNRKIGRLLVLEFVGVVKKHATWRCVCDCGKEHLATTGNLNRMKAPSCGCWSAELASARLKTHGETHSVEFRIWGGIKTRTTNPNDPGYENYGARGIVMSEDWLNSFETFLRDMGRRPSPKHSIDRIEVNGPYSKENCRWATGKEQARNRRSNRRIEYSGETLTVAEWNERLGFKRGVLGQRLLAGWSEVDAITIPHLPRPLRSRGHRKMAEDAGF